MKRVNLQDVYKRQPVMVPSSSTPNSRTPPFVFASATALFTASSFPVSYTHLTSLSIALINRASSNYGDSVIAGMGAVTRITSMGTLVVFGFLKGFQDVYKRQLKR